MSTLPAKKSQCGSSDPYLEWAYNKAIEKPDDANSGSSPYSIQLLIECTASQRKELEESLDDTQAKIHDNFIPIFSEITNNSSKDLHIYTVSTDLPHLVQWQKDNKLTNIRVEYATTRYAPAPDKSLNPSWNYEKEKLDGNVMVVIDDGLAFLNECFRKSTDRKRTRIKYFWDQNPCPYGDNSAEQMRHDSIGQKSRAPWRYPLDFFYGRELGEAGINSILQTLSDPLSEEEAYRRISYDRVRHALSHGTHVADLAVGRLNSDTSRDGSDISCKDDTHVIMIQLPPKVSDDTSGGGLAKYTLDAIKYALSKVTLSANVVVNLSFGATGGRHDGESLFESALDQIISDENSRRNFAVILPAGNHFEKSCHVASPLKPGASKDIHWQICSNDPTDSFCEVWIDTIDAGEFSVDLLRPDGSMAVSSESGWTRYESDDRRTSCCAITTVARPSSTKQNFSLALISVRSSFSEDASEFTAPSGQWIIRITSKSENKVISLDAWIQRDEPAPNSQQQDRQSFFVSNFPPRDANDDDNDDDMVKRRGTGNSIANGAHSIVVGACYKISGNLSPYTAASPLTNSLHGEIWPDLVAPGDLTEAMPGILAAGAISGMSVRMNGTSVAAPQVARSVLNLFGGSYKPHKKNWDRQTIVQALRPRDSSRPSPGKNPVKTDGMEKSRVGGGRLLSQEEA